MESRDGESSPSESINVELEWILLSPFSSSCSSHNQEWGGLFINMHVIFNKKNNVSFDCCRSIMFQHPSSGDSFMGCISPTRCPCVL